jgi:hypothetical protein
MCQRASSRKSRASSPIGDSTTRIDTPHDPDRVDASIAPRCSVWQPLRCMTELDELRASPVPRPAALCRRFAGRIDSIWGFILYGILWFCCACGIATLGLLVGVTVVGHVPEPLGIAVVVLCWVGSFVGSWVPFVRWVRRRRGAAERLFREGAFVDARVQEVHHLWMRGAPFTRAVLRATDELGAHRIGLSVGGHPPLLREGASMPVLLVRGYGYCAVFPPGGRLVTSSRTDG